MKFKHLLTILFVLVICMSLVLTAVACDKDKTDETDNTEQQTDTTDNTNTEEETLLVTNGRFESYSDGSAPNSPNSWTGSTSDSTVDSVVGVVPMKQTDYTEAMTAWDNLAYPGNVPDGEDDNHALLIYNKDSVVYSYKPQTDFETTIGAYYKFTVQLLVKRGEVGLSDGSGAYVTFSGAAYHRFGPFTESDAWQTVTFYVAASQVSAKNITINLSLGTANNPSKGYVFFDNVLAEKISADNYAAADTADTVHTARYSMLVPDGDFINSTDTEAVQSPAIWSGKKGSGNGNDCNDNYVRKGIVSTDAEGWAAWLDASTLTGDSIGTPYDKETVKDGLSDDGKILAISNQYALAPNGSSLLEECYTAYGYTNTTKMHIAPNTAYAVSVWVYTDLNTAAFVTDVMTDRAAGDLDSVISHDLFGANIIFSGYGDYSFTNINTEKTWKQYTFYVVGSATRYTDINIELWLGKGGMSDITRASGTVYFDNLTLTQLNYNTRADALNACNDFVTSAVGSAVLVDIQDSGVELVNNGSFADGENGWTLSTLNDVRAVENVDYKKAVIDTVANADKDAAWWQEQYGLEANPLAPHAYNPVLMINHINPSAYTLRTTDTITIKSNLHYRLAVWLKTADIKSGSGVTVAIVNNESDSVITSFTSINTANYENEIEGVNGYVQLEFYLRGSNYQSELSAEADDKEVYIKITFGSGNNFDTSGFLSGKVFIADVNMQQIDASEYSAHTSNTTYSKSYSFTSSSGSTSGSFADSKFDVVTYDEETIDTELHVQKKLFKPSSWTTASVTNLNSGILNITQQAFVDNLRTLTQYDFVTVYNAWDDSVSEQVKADYTVDFGAPNVFMAYTTKDEKVKASKILNNTSSITLSTNKYYVIRCYVRAVGTVGELEFTTIDNKTSKVISFGDVNDTVGKWQEISFVVKTGTFASTNATVNLYIGAYSTEHSKDSAEQAEYQGIIFADSFTCYSIDEDTYNAYVDDGTFAANYTTETFDTTSTSTSTTAPYSSLWSGSGSSDNTKVVGIYNRNYTTTTLKYLESKETTDEEGNTKTEDVAVEEKAIDKATVFNTDGLSDGVTLGDAVLVINNQTAGYYNYKSAAITLSSNTAYALSLDARTFNIKEGEWAYIRMTMGSENYDFAINSEHAYKVDANGEYVLVDGANTYEENGVSKWARYTVYVHNSKSSSVTAYVYLMLGMSATDADTEDSHPVQGTVLFDNVTLETISVDSFNEQLAKVYVLDDEKAITKDEDGKEIKAAGAAAYQLSNKVVLLADDYSSEPEDNDNKDTDTEPEKTDSSMIWLYVTSIVIAGILIIVVLVYVIRRFMPKNIFKRKKKIDYDRNNAGDGADKGKKEPAAEAKSDEEDFTD